MKRSILVSLIMSMSIYMLTAATLFYPTEAEARSHASMSCYDLWYARNSIFADQGYCFESQRTINTFGRRCYSPYGRLSTWQKNQVSDIKYWERRKGCSNGYARSYTSSRSGGYASVRGIRWDDTLAVRTGPSTRYRRIGGLAPDATGIEILECTSKWCRIRYGRTVGWSYAKYLRFY